MTYLLAAPELNASVKQLFGHLRYSLWMSELKRTLLEDVKYPPHEPRTQSTLYKHTHKHLVYELDTPCWICGVKNSTGGAMETHHDELEWAAANGVDLDLIIRDFPALTDREKLQEWLDSEGNMLVLCDVHHRGSRTGIHSITYPAWKLQRWQGTDWKFIEQNDKDI